ncbi:MAG TPA: cyclic nucleotide-binding and patatin-like phospholipase domain-containing protein [Acidimicrobiales bacterium]|nr:cyclic nucleotide-binding and patatin-like phospholipase domain-containing protein [Acidimicrobiales bacterium]
MTTENEATRQGPNTGLSFFDSLPPMAAGELIRAAREVRLPARSTVFVEGDPGNAAYLIRSGLVDVVAEGAGTTAGVVTFGPGDVFGEQALLTGRPRSATALCQTGVRLWRIDHADFLAAVASVPELGAAVARLLSDRLAASGRHAGFGRGQTVLVMSDHPGVLAGVVTPLARACGAFLGEEPCIVAPARRGGWGTMPPHTTGVPGRDMAGVTVRAVRHHPLVLVVCGRSVPSSLLDGCDRAVVVGHHHLEPRRHKWGRRDVAVPATLDADGVAALARDLCGRRIGLALGSGGIRGFAHAGVLGVLADRSVPIDIMSGASVGAMAGALFLRGHGATDLADLGSAVRAALGTGLPSFSLSPDSLLSGRRILTFLRRRLGADTRIEDLPTPFVIAATDLDRREAVHLDAGPLAESVAASAAVPGVFPSVDLDGRRLVDGGASDPVPVGALRDRGADIVVAINVMGSENRRRSRLLPWTLPGPLENVFAVSAVMENLVVGLDVIISQLAAASCRWADVVVTPVTEPVPRFHAVPARASMRAGEQAMLAALPEVMTLLGAAGPTVDDR